MVHKKTIRTNQPGPRRDYGVMHQEQCMVWTEVLQLEVAGGHLSFHMGPLIREVWDISDMDYGACFLITFL